MTEIGVRKRLNIKIDDFITSPASTFELPSDEVRKNLKVNDDVKLVFSCKGHASERMWVKITKVINQGFYEGKLNGQPFDLPMTLNDVVSFSWSNIINIWKSPANDADKIFSAINKYFNGIDIQRETETTALELVGEMEDIGSCPECGCMNLIVTISQPMFFKVKINLSLNEAKEISPLSSTDPIQLNCGREEASVKSIRCEKCNFDLF